MFKNRSTRRAAANPSANQKCTLRLETLEDRRVLATVFALLGNNLLVTFDSATPDVIRGSRRIVGVPERIEFSDIDFRPATGELYALSDTANAVYKIALGTGVATRVGPGAFNPNLSGSSFGMDFNPVVDRIRIVSDLDQNLRVHPDTGVIAFVDTPLQYAAADPNAGKNPYVVSAAYSNNFNGTPSTTLYDIDSQLNILVTQSPPNDGTLNTVGPLGVDVNQLTGFDIQMNNTALASFDIGPSGSRLYKINLATGAATLVGNIGTNVVVRDIAVQPGVRSDSPDRLVTAQPGYEAAPAVAVGTASIVKDQTPQNIDASIVADDSRPTPVSRVIKRLPAVTSSEAIDKLLIDMFA